MNELTPSQIAHSVITEQARECGLSEALISLPYNQRSMVAYVRGRLDAAVVNLSEAGCGFLWMKLNEGENFDRVADVSGFAPEVVKLCTLQAHSAGFLKLPGVELPQRRSLSTGKSALSVYSSEQLNLGYDFGTVKELTAQSKKQADELIRIDAELRVALNKTAVAESKAEAAAERIKEHFDEHGQPKWVPANNDQRQLAADVERLLDSAARFSAQIKYLRCRQPVEDLQMGMLHGLFDHIRAIVNEGIATVEFSLGEIDSEQLGNYVTEADYDRNELVQPKINAVRILADRKDGIAPDRVASASPPASAPKKPRKGREGRAVDLPSED